MLCGLNHFCLSRPLLDAPRTCSLHQWAMFVMKPNVSVGFVSTKDGFVQPPLFSDHTCRGAREKAPHRSKTNHILATLLPKVQALHRQTDNWKGVSYRAIHCSPSGPISGHGFHVRSSLSCSHSGHHQTRGCSTLYSLEAQ